MLPPLIEGWINEGVRATIILSTMIIHELGV